MFTFYKISLFLHLLSACFWIGGMLFTSLVLVPTLRNKIFGDYKGAFYRIMGHYFSKISWLLFLVFLLTGYFQLSYKGFNLTYLWHHLEFWQKGYGQVLFYKLLFFAIMLVISVVHDFHLGPKAARLIDKEPQGVKTIRYRKWVSWVGRLNLILALFILFFALTLVRG